MTCSAFERWLDDGMPEPLGAGARAHAAGCAHCAAALAAAREIDAGLMRARFTAPAQLTDSVMARVEAIETVSAAAVGTARIWRDALPWWVRAASDPAAIGAASLCALLVWQWDRISGAGVAAAVWLASVAARASLPGSTQPGSLGIQIALAMILVPASLWFGRASFRLSERWVERMARPRT